MRRSRRFFYNIASIGLFAFFLAPSAPARTADWIRKLGLSGPLRLFYTPAPRGHEPVLKAIDSARDTVLMTMFHLNDPEVVEALIDAQSRGVTVRVILDGKTIAQPKYAAFADQLRRGGVQVMASSPVFSITHEKALIIDNQRALILSMNLSAHFQTMRDWGVVTSDAGVVKEMIDVFETDWTNAKNRTGVSPAIRNPNLLWSPVNARAKLKDLIESADHELLLTVENISDPIILAALEQASRRNKIKVRLIVPRCDYHSNPYFNYPSLYRLQRSGVEIRLMPNPETARHPYMHAKMLDVDGKRAYIGSVNYSRNSTLYARELGVVLIQSSALRTIARKFKSDWSVSEPLPRTQPNDCP